MKGTDFVKLKERFDRLTPGQRADIRRAQEPEDLKLVGAAYKLWPGGERSLDSSFLRVVFFLPDVPQQEGALPLGRQLHYGQIDEKRLFQVLRSEEPNDLEHLRRLCRHVKPSADWAKLGPLLYYWNRDNKQRLLQDFYLAENELELLEQKGDSDE